MTMDSKSSKVEHTTAHRGPVHIPLRRVLVAAALILLLLVHTSLFKLATESDPLPYCDHIPPISREEYLQRQTSLATKLRELNAIAYIAEPGANTQYYANFSTGIWSLSERPLLLIIQLQLNNSATAPKVTILTPKFEITRARLLPIPAPYPVNYVEWPEDADPYQVAATALSINTGLVFVDSAIRHFVVDGLQRALPQASVASAPIQISLLRESKSRTELDILKCVNEATLLAIRTVHKDMYIGMRESEASNMMVSALAKFGLKDGGCLTLFGDNAALPHGRGTDQILGKSDFALFDCSASLHEYKSDVTRTVALPQSHISEEHLSIWRAVQAAQSVASSMARSQMIAFEVDQAARLALVSHGLGPYFTHRLGHGIGLEVHEAPYLHAGSHARIQTGHSFSIEPGVYIEGDVGVRLEDCASIDQDGSAVLLTAGVGGQAVSPWFP